MILTLLFSTKTNKTKKEKKNWNLSIWKMTRKICNLWLLPCIPLESSHTRFLRDCLEGLRSQEDVPRLEISLKSAENLIRKTDPSALEEISEPFTTTLLALQDSFQLDNFSLLRQKALVALVVKSPRRVSGVLTQLFYAPQWNLQQRLDALDALIDGALELSNFQVEGESGVSQGEDDSNQKSLSEASEVLTPDEILRQRIEKKTRRWGSRRKPSVTYVNHFRQVAGLFFFPLASAFDSSRSHLDLLGRDSFVLSRLLYALGTFLECQGETPKFPVTLRWLGPSGNNNGSGIAGDHLGDSFSSRGFSETKFVVFSFSHLSRSLSFFSHWISSRFRSRSSRMARRISSRGTRRWNEEFGSSCFDLVVT